jgi:transposase
MATPGLLAHIVVSKVEDALPFHGQSKQFARMGIDLPRASLCDWARQVAEKAAPLTDLMDRAIREGPIVTTVEVIHPNLNFGSFLDSFDFSYIFANLARWGYCQL